MVAALYVQRGGVYWDLPGVDPWDEERDARLYAGPWPVVAHPPCQRWSVLAGQIEARFGHKRGEDGGCFAAALESVRRWGGVLEHPAYTQAFRSFGMPVPGRGGGWAGSLGDPGWSCWVDQYWYGHQLNKPTWLYVVGIDPPALRWGKGRGMLFPNFSTGLSKHQRQKITIPTPLAFRDVLLEMARSASRPVHSVTPLVHSVTRATPPSVYFDGRTI